MGVCPALMTKGVADTRERPHPMPQFGCKGHGVKDLTYTWHYETAVWLFTGRDLARGPGVIGGMPKRRLGVLTPS